MYNESIWQTLKRAYLGWPIAIRTIITANVLVFLVQTFSGPAADNFIISNLGFSTQWNTALFEPWRFVTYMFLHGGVFHILFNMLWLWWMGRAVEETLGSRFFTFIYFGSGIGGALLDIPLSLIFGQSLVIGASGAVFGVMVAFAVLYPRMPIMLFLLPPIEARFVVGGLIVLQLLFISSGGPIARSVHLGGALCGFLIMKSRYKSYGMSDLFAGFEKFMSHRRRKSGKVKNDSMHSVSEADVVDETKQDELDRILDKISKSGYQGLTDEEKRILFELSKRS